MTLQRLRFAFFIILAVFATRSFAVQPDEMMKDPALEARARASEANCSHFVRRCSPRFERCSPSEGEHLRSEVSIFVGLCPKIHLVLRRLSGV